MNPLSCRLEILPGAKISDKLFAAKRFGFDAAALPGRFLGDYIQDLRSSFSGIPVPLSSISLGFEGSLVSGRKESRERCRESVLDIFRICAEFNIPNFNMPPALASDNPDIPGDRETCDKLLIAGLPVLLEEARKRGITVLLEPVNRYESVYMNTLEHAARICETLSHPFLGITADLFHMQMEELSFYDAIKRAGKHIKYFHAAENTRCEPGPGSMDFDSAFRGLKEINYSGYIEVESRFLSGEPGVSLPESVRFLRKKLGSACKS